VGDGNYLDHGAGSAIHDGEREPTHEIPPRAVNIRGPALWIITDPPDREIRLGNEGHGSQ